MNHGETRNVATVLMITRDPIASQQISDVLREHALSIEVTVDPALASRHLSHRKFEAVIVDSALEDQAMTCFRQIRSSALNRTAVAFALTRGSQETAVALRNGFSFVLERPLSPESISHTLKVAYGLIVRERRRYFRYPVVVPAVLCRKNEAEVFGRTVNVSESGMALSASVPLPAGSEGTVQFTLPEPSLRITAESKVCWNDAKGHAGLLFLFLPSDQASQLQAWLARKLEEQLPQLVAEKFRSPAPLPGHNR